MNTLEQRVTDFSLAFRKIQDQFQRANAAIANGPHAELNQHEIRLIERLRVAGFQKMKSISEYLGVAVNSVTSIVDHLEKKSLVTRQRSADDRRVVHVYLTEQGAMAADASLTAKQQLMKSLLEVLPDDEQEQLVTLSWKIAAMTPTSTAELAL